MKDLDSRKELQKAAKVLSIFFASGIVAGSTSSCQR